MNISVNNAILYSISKFRSSSNRMLKYFASSSKLHHTSKYMNRRTHHIRKNIKSPNTLLELHPFINDDYKPGEPRVAAFYVNAAYDLMGLRAFLKSKGCDAAIKGNFLISEGCAYFEQQNSSAVFFKNGCAVLWNMSPPTEKFVLQCAQTFEKQYVTGSLDSLFVGETEEMEVYDTDSKSFIDESALHLTTSKLRTTDKIAFSLALMTSVRLNSLERKIEYQLQNERLKAEKLLKNMKYSNLDTLGETLFNSMTEFHNLQYELNIKQELLDMPDLLWEFDEQSRLFIRLQTTFDVRQRIDQLNARLKWMFSFLETFADYVDKLHSSRLEKIIILLIFLEFVLGIFQTFRGDHFLH